MTTEYRKRKACVLNDNGILIADNRSKRGRGRGSSRGLHTKSRGSTRTRFPSQSMSSYGVANTQNIPRVCVNPEILKLLATVNPSI